MDCSTPGFPVLHCLPEFANHLLEFDNDRFVGQYEVREGDAPALFFFSGLFGLFRVFCVSMQNYLFLFCEKYQWYFDRGYIESILCIG